MIFFGSKSCRPKEVSGELMVVVVVVGCVVVLTFIKKKMNKLIVDRAMEQVGN